MSTKIQRAAVAAAILALLALLPASANASDLAELQQRQEKVKAALKKVIPATVAVTGGVGMGSGVVVSEDGYVLTAGHVSGKPDRDVTLVFSDGTMVEGKTLGANRSVDAGMIKISEPGPWPHVEIGKTSDLKRGDWVICTGHPGGYRVGRTPPVRLGKVQLIGENTIVSDATLIGGDSGGPLFDLDGKLVGIHSSIGTSLAENRHVPIDRFVESWDRMAKGEAWGSLADMARFRPPPELAKGGFLGVRLAPTEDGVTVAEVISDSAAEKAGLQTGDVIRGVNGKQVESVRGMVLRVAQNEPGTRVTLDVKRGDRELEVEAVLGKRPEQPE